MILLLILLLPPSALGDECVTNQQHTPVDLYALCAADPPCARAFYGVQSESWVAMIQRLAAGPTLAFGRVKDLVLQSTDSLETQMEKETRAIADSSRTADARGAIAAFLEKRKPTFSGR